MHVIQRRAVVLATFAAVAGCAEGDSDREAAVRRDSAGVGIVENTAPQWTEQQWHVDTVPSLTISAADDPDLVRLGSPLLLRDDRLVYFNGGNCEVRIHDTAGVLLGTSGRCGEGPGEFDQFARLWRWVSDSILVVDRLNRVSVLASDGSFGRILSIPSTPEMPLPFIRGVLANGSLILSSLRDPVGRTTPGVESGTLTVAILPPGAEPSDVGSFPGPRFEYTEFGGRLGRNVLAFSASTEIAAGADEVIIGFPDRYEIRVYDRNGALERVMRRVFEPVPVQARDIEWLMNRRLEEVEGEENQRLVRQAFRDLNHEPVMPAFGVPVWPGGADGGPALIIDETAHIWVYEHYRPGEYQNRWTVFSPSGRWLGDVRLPDHFTPTRIGQTYVLGVWLDGVGFQHIRRYALSRE